MLGGWAPMALVTGSFAAHRAERIPRAGRGAAGTAYDTLENLRLEPPSTLLVNGAGGGSVCRWCCATGARAVLSELARLVAAGELDPMVVEVRPLDEAGEALALVENGHATGKLVLVP